MIALRWAPAIVYAVGIYVASAQTSLPQFASLLWDKAQHAFLYAGFALTLGFALTKPGASITMSRGFTAVALGALYAASDEWHQSFVPGRSADPADWLADVIGLVVGIAAYAAWSRIYRGPRPNSRRR